MERKESDATKLYETVCGYNCAPFDPNAAGRQILGRGLGTVVYTSRGNGDLFKRGEIYTENGVFFIRSEDDEYDSIVQWMSSAPFKTEEGKVCNDCLDAKAELSCEECEEVFCKECSSRVHSGGKRAQHELMDL